MIPARRRGRPPGRPYGVLCVGIVAFAIAGCGDSPNPAAPSASPAEAPKAPVPPVTASVPSSRKPGEMLQVGDVAPEFKVRDDTGKTRTLAEFKGRRLVVWFFPKAATPG